MLLHCCWKWQQTQGRSFEAHIGPSHEKTRLGSELWRVALPRLQQTLGWPVSTSCHCQSMKWEASQGAEGGGVWTVPQAGSWASMTPLPRWAPGTGAGQLCSTDQLTLLGLGFWPHPPLRQSGRGGATPCTGHTPCSPNWGVDIESCQPERRTCD